MVLAAWVVACAQPQLVLPPASMTVKKPAAEKKIEIFTPLSKKTGVKPSDKIVRVEGMSSQPWARMIGTHPGWSAFPEPERQDPALNLLWVGASPK
jgi:hypothetical protein